MKLQAPVIKTRRNGRVAIILNGFTKGRAKRYIRRYAKRLGVKVESTTFPDVYTDSIDVYWVAKGKQVRIIFWNGTL